MIPKKIEFKNFLSYGPETTTVDFSNYHLICLSGKNGHGKSALLDAMTWAIWGQARKTTGTSKADEGLLHLGQKHMLVVFDFEIQGQSFRVRREYVKTKSKPFTALDFGIIKDDDQFTPMTDKTIKGTQQKIEETTGITYESFVNSAFLRQGQSNEFSKKSSKERKEVLASILHLEQFDILKKAATEKNKTLQQTILQKQSISERISNDINQLTETLKQQDIIQKELKDITHQEKILLKELQHNESEKSKCLEQQKKYDLLQQQIEDKNKQLTEVNTQINELNTIYQSVIQQQKNKFDPQKLELDLKQAEEKVKAHQKKLNKRLELKEQYLLLQEESNKAFQQIQQDENEALQKITIHKKITEEQRNTTHKQIQASQTQLKQLEEQINKINTQLKTETETLKLLEKKVQEVKKRETEFETKKTTYQTVVSQGSHLKQQLLDIDKKQQLASEISQPCCPLCEQNLSASRKKFLHQKLEDEKEKLTTEMHKVKESALALKDVLQKEHIVITQQQKNKELFTQKTSEIDFLHKQIQPLQKQIESCKQEQLTLQKDLQESEKKLLEIEKESTQNVKKSEIQINYESALKKIDALKQTAQKLAYNKEQHDSDQTEFVKLEEEWKSYLKFQANLLEQKQREEEINKLKKQHITLQAEALEAEKQQVQLAPALKQLTSLQTALEKIKSETDQLNKQKNNLLQKKGALDSEAKKQQLLKAELTSIDKELTTLTQEAQDYIDIIKAVGKDGLQALLIEEAIPEIEQEANLLLAELTNNQTHILIESLRDLKKGGSKETLDIKISDTAGLRPYEMFSGGEAFRIDFALRVAISKLLARRAGTSLQTLIIDEGFGSQDEESLQLIMDCIHKIQDNFAKVIVVSHLPNLKEQFPVHFHIQKKATGSCITITEQG